MKLFAMALQLFRAAAEAPEESDEADLHEANDREQEEDRSVHASADRGRAAEADGASVGFRCGCNYRDLSTNPERSEGSPSQERGGSFGVFAPQD